MPDGLPDIADPGVWERHAPHETFAWLRAHDPVSWWPLRDGDGFWAVALHQDVLAVSRDVATFSSRGGVISYEDLPAEQADARRTMLEELAARVGGVELADPARRLRSNHINGLKELPLRLG
jgi:hypothetical protein